MKLLLVFACLAALRAPDDAALRAAIAAQVAAVQASADPPPAGGVQLGSEAIPDLFTVVADGAVPASWSAEGERIPLHPSTRELLLDALAAMPATPLREHLTRLAEMRVRDTAHVVAALEVLARVGSTLDVALCIHLAAPGAEEAGVPRARRVAFEETLKAIAGLDPNAIWLLKGAFAELHPSLLAPAVRCIGASATPERLAVLASLLGRVAAIDAMLLLEIARVAKGGEDPIDETVRVNLRYALGSRDRNEVVLAIGALAAVEDHDAIPRLIDLLTDEEERVRVAANAALERMTGRVFRGNARAWDDWYSNELEWWRTSAATLRGVDDPDPLVVLRSLRDISGHRLYSHELARAVSAALDRSERELVLLACSILRSLDSRVAVPALVRVLGHGDPEVVAATLRVLQGITGLKHPADPAVWKAALDPESSSSHG